MGRIFRTILQKENFAIIYGDKGLEKVDFSESLCVYLLEREIINDYKIFRINSKLDYEYMNYKIKENIQDLNFILYKKKNIIIIKFDFDDDKVSYNYMKMIHDDYCIDNNNLLYFIFIFNADEKKMKKLDTNFQKHIFSTTFDKHSSEIFFSHLIRVNNLNITDSSIKDLLIKAENKPYYLRRIIQLLLHGISVDNILKMEKPRKDCIDLNEIQNKRAFSYYLLLSNMPSGLPVKFLELIFDDFYAIKDVKNLIEENKDNL